MKSRCVLLLSTLAVVACSAAPTPRPTGAVPDLRRDQVDATDGRILYGNLCASCHGVDARGGGPVAEALSVAMPDLTRLVFVPSYRCLPASLFGLGRISVPFSVYRHAYRFNRERFEW